ncbi:hypothetical protein N7513_003274 [Penicillium frequentans]|uniref:Uncharacterized protein n=1 Tax=Penicillium frequentans TaxID=3151616 RepID=A0AAD6G8J2_9EURO|nr:hypothetical protein N7494_013170 [Penicillium glabrum]KAJ5557688.1 hypothetical protein N7513_003274 [Penicillium glabrum]
MDFDSPVVANQATDQSLYWNSEVHSVVLFYRDGRVKLCRKCQKPGMFNHTAHTKVSYAVTVQTSTGPGSARPRVAA